VVATGILSIHDYAPTLVAQLHGRLRSAYGERFLLGLGVSHADVLARNGLTVGAPLVDMKGFIDGLDSAIPPLSRQERCLAALGPKMTALARERAWGAHPYFTTPAHTATARAILGHDALLAPEQMVVLESNAERARAIARPVIRLYLTFRNYVASLLREGFRQTDLVDGGSDRLLDAIVVHGDVSEIASRVREHLDAGATHVSLQVLTEDASELPLTAWRRLAAALPALTGRILPTWSTL
jgi:probable F420-dependent oxidoreductase